MRQGFGWSVRTPSFDWPTLIANKDTEIARLEGLYRQGLERAGATILQARAELADAHTLPVQPGDRKITAKTILVATGGRPVVPDVPGVGHAITSNEAFHLDALPNSILIVGGGYIAVEFAGIFNGLGAETTLLYRGEKILRGFDEELRDRLTEELFKRGIDVVCNAEIASIDKGWTQPEGDAEGRQHARGRQGDVRHRAHAQHRAASGSRRPASSWASKGEIRRATSTRATSVENIYAVGDVTDRVNLTPVAIREGHAFADTVFGSKPTDRRPRADPDRRVLHARDRHRRPARAQGARALPQARYLQGALPPLKHTLSGRDERMLMKLLVDGESDRVVGCHVLGADAAEIVQMAAIAMRMGATKADFDATMALHPSAAEELVTMREKWMPPASAAPTKPATEEEGLR